MKKLVAVVVLVLAAFLVYNRQRLYLRDPMGSLTRNGVKEVGTQVYINYSNDVLLENDNPPMYVTVVQHGNNRGQPGRLHCIHYVMCLTNADVVSVTTEESLVVESMSRKAVVLREPSQEIVVTLH